MISPMGRRLMRAAALTGASLAIGVWSSGERGRTLDRQAFRALNAAPSPALGMGAKAITELGSWWACLGASAALALAGRRRTALTALGAATVTWAAGQGLKRVLLRPRPSDEDPDGVRLGIARPHGTSWPSSHPAVLQTFLAVAGRGLALSSPALRATDALAGVVGLSRVVVGVHYPSDVAGGLLLGRAVAAAWPFE